MRIAARICPEGVLVVAALALGGGLGCSKRTLPPGMTGRIDAGPPGSGGGGASGSGAGGAGGPSTTGTGGAAGMAAACSAGDPRLLVADQRILRLTTNELLNTVRYLFGSTEATALVADGVIAAGDSADINRRFPPLQDHVIDDTAFTILDRVASHVASYVLANFAVLAACPNATDDCATRWLGTLAARAYRRTLTADEQSRFTALYTKLRTPQTVNGYQVTFTVEEATSYAVEALLSAPQMLWRWEVGDQTAAPSTGPAGVPLTEQELATLLAFFLTDQPPDDRLLQAADAGTLRLTFATQVDRLLATQTARDWLRTIIETVFQLNQLPAVQIDAGRFPTFSARLDADMALEARRFLDDALWNGNLTDLLLSRKAFLNTNLAQNVYLVPAPPGATAENFVWTTLPADRRAGLLTNAAFLTTRAHPDGHGLVVPRGLFIDTVLLCLPYPGPDMSTSSDRTNFATQTSREQVDARAAQPACNTCHAEFDAYGLALDNYDAIGRYRTVDDLGQAVDAHVTLPAALGGGAVANAAELADRLAASPAFTNCMARTLLQDAMVESTYGADFDVPLPPQQPGCATADVVQRYQSAGGKTFTDLVRATTAAPAFALRRAAP